jgi:hypothetical protein
MSFPQRALTSLAHCVTALVLLCAGAQSQTLLGVGPRFHIPLAALRDANGSGYGGSLELGSRKFCRLWPMFGLDYARFSKHADSAEAFYQSNLALHASLRYFFEDPTSVPVYIQAGLMLGGIGGRDSASLAGFGGKLSAGILWPYKSPCCDPFVDVRLTLEAPNFILRGKARPALYWIDLGVSFFLSL